MELLVLLRKVKPLQEFIQNEMQQLNDIGQSDDEIAKNEFSFGIGMSFMAFFN